MAALLSFLVLGVGAQQFKATSLTDALSNGKAITFYGIVADDKTGFSLGSAGDFNGDGCGDIAIGSPNANLTYGGVTKKNCGKVSLVFGSNTSTISSAINGTAHRIITYIGPSLHDTYGGSGLGTAVSQLGGFHNGDNYSDFAVSAPRACTDTGCNYIMARGIVYIVYGSADATDLAGSTLYISELSSSEVRRMNGNWGHTGNSATALAMGDFDGDEYADAIAGSPDGDWGTISAAYGASSPSSGKMTFVADSDFKSSNGFSVAMAGDLTGDGKGDAIACAPDFDSKWNGVTFDQSGACYIYSAEDSSGKCFIAAQLSLQLGTTTCGLGDINGDGFADILMSASKVGSGTAYVLFGGPNKTYANKTNLLEYYQTSGFAITGISSNDSLGEFASALGDFNGDGVDDFAVAAPQSRKYAGTVYVIFGHKGSWDTTFNLNGLNGANGFAIYGRSAGDQIGRLASAGDFNCDGMPDLLIGAPNASPNGKSKAGEVFVYFGEKIAYPTLVANEVASKEGSCVALTSASLLAQFAYAAGSLSFSVKNVTAGMFSKDNVTAVSSFTQAQVNGSQVFFCHFGSESLPTARVFITDGLVVSSAVGIVFSHTRVNDPPKLLTDKRVITYYEGYNASLIIDLAGSDPDNATFLFSFLGLVNCFICLYSDGTGVVSQYANSTAGYIGLSGSNASLLVSLSDGLLSTNWTYFSVKVDTAPQTFIGTIDIFEGEDEPLPPAELQSIDDTHNSSEVTFLVLDANHVSVYVNGSKLMSFTQLQIDQNLVHLLHDGNEDAPTMQLRVTDGRSFGPSFNMTFNFTNVNDAPASYNSLSTQTSCCDASVGVPYSFTYATDTFVDPEGDNITYSLNQLPSWLSFKANSHTFEGTPSLSDVGTSVVVLSASDGSLQASQSLAIIVSVSLTATAKLACNSDSKGACNCYFTAVAIHSPSPNVSVTLTSTGPAIISSASFSAAITQISTVMWSYNGAPTAVSNITTDIVYTIPKSGVAQTVNLSATDELGQYVSISFTATCQLSSSSAQVKTSNSKNSSTGIIIGIAVGLPGCLAIAGLGIFATRRLHKRGTLNSGGVPMRDDTVASRVSGDQVELDVSQQRLSQQPIVNRMSFVEKHEEQSELPLPAEMSSIVNMPVSTMAEKEKEEPFNKELKAGVQPEDKKVILMREPLHRELCAGVQFEYKSEEVFGKDLRKVEQLLAGSFQQHHEDYVIKRIKAGKAPLVFLTMRAWKIENNTLSHWFNLRREYMANVLKRSEEELEVRIGFHGTMPENIDLICKNGLLRVGHPMNPSQKTDGGYFGDPHYGVYVTRFIEYSLQYANMRIYCGEKVVCPLDEGQTARVIVMSVLPGRSFHVEHLEGGLTPKNDRDSFSSPEFAEWFLYDETQALPQYIVEFKAIPNTRISANEV